MADEENTLVEHQDNEEIEIDETELGEQEAGQAEAEIEEVEIVLDGDEQASQQTQSKTVTLPASKLAKLRETRREAREQAEELERQNELLRQQLSLTRGGPQKQAQDDSAIPTLESCDYDESKYHAKLAEWNGKQFQKQIESYQQNQMRQHQAAQMKQQMESEIESHFERAASLRVSDYESAERNVRSVLGGDKTDMMIAFLGDGSEKVAYYLGKNPDKLHDLAATLQADPSGLRAMAKLGELRGKLNVRPATKKISSAPTADEPLTGGASSANDAAILKRLDKLNKLPNRDKFRTLKKELVASGKADLLKSHGYM